MTIHIRNRVTQASRDWVALSEEIRIKGRRSGRQEYILAFLFIKLVTHVLGRGV
jgi:hypothetical protein